MLYMAITREALGNALVFYALLPPPVLLLLA